MPASPYTDLTRPPLKEAALRQALVNPASLWSDLRVVAETGSTNADVVATARARAPEGLVVIAESQTAGRGRLERAWVSPARAGITASVLLRPGSGVPASRLGWLPLLAGVALAETVAQIAMVDAALKWPNDLLVRPPLGDDAGAGFAKCGGILAEAVAGAPGGSHAVDELSAGGEARGGTGRRAGTPADGESPAIVLGIGLNVTQRAEELPPPPDPAAPPATSLAMVGAACTDRDPLLRGLLRALADWYGRWRAVDGDPHTSGLREAYRGCCTTLGRDVAVTLPGGAVVVGRASDVDSDGRLIVVTGDGVRTLAAGDVRHVR